MSVQQHAAKSGELGLPAPRSPRELDRKVLRYAESRVPEAAKGPNRLLWWGSGLATASVAALALLVALPPSGTSPQTAVGPPPPVPSLHDARAPAETAASAEPPLASSASRMLTEAPRATAFQAPPADAEADTAVTADLERLAGLLDAGRETEARQGYRALRARCPRCELPPSLEQALGRDGAGAR